MNDVEPWSFVAGDGIPIDVTDEHIESARQLIEEGWHQTSRAYRMLARLPDGMTGVEALIDAERRSQHPQSNVVKWANGLGNAGAGEHYLRCYASRDLHGCTLDIPTFSAFKKLGGGTYGSWYYDTHRSTR